MTRALLLVALCAAARGDRWKPFRPRVVTSANGRHAVDLRPADGGVAFELRAGGEPLASGVVAHVPYEVVVLAGAPAAIFFETWAAIGRGTVLSRLDRTGRLAWRVTLADLFDKKAIDGFRRTVSSTWWKRAWWVDETSGKAVLVSAAHHLRTVDLETGAVASVDERILLPAIRLPHARRTALELAIGMAPHGLRAVVEPLAKDDFLAAVALQVAGGAPVPRARWDAAVAEDVAADDKALAVRLAATHHPEPLAFLEAAVLREDLALAAVGGLEDLGAARVLAGVVAHGGIDAAVRAHAGRALGGLPAGDVVPAIEREFADADPRTAAALLDAAVATGAPALDARLMKHERKLVKVLDSGKGPVAWLADYFKTRPTSEATRPLTRALARHRRNPVVKRKLIDALKSCTGYDLGDNPDAWIRALRNR